MWLRSIERRGIQDTRKLLRCLFEHRQTTLLILRNKGDRWDRLLRSVAVVGLSTWKKKYAWKCLLQFERRSSKLNEVTEPRRQFHDSWIAIRNFVNRVVISHARARARNDEEKNMPREVLVAFRLQDDAMDITVETTIRFLIKFSRSHDIMALNRDSLTAGFVRLKPISAPPRDRTSHVLMSPMTLQMFSYHPSRMHQLPLRSIHWRTRINNYHLKLASTVRYLDLNSKLRIFQLNHD